MKNLAYFSGMFLLLLSPMTCTFNPDGSVNVDTSNLSESEISNLRETTSSDEYTYEIVDGEPILKPKKP